MGLKFWISTKQEYGVFSLTYWSLRRKHLSFESIYTLEQRIFDLLEIQRRLFLLLFPCWAEIIRDHRSWSTQNKRTETEDQVLKIIYTTKPGLFQEEYANHFLLVILLSLHRLKQLCNSNLQAKPLGCKFPKTLLAVFICLYSKKVLLFSWKHTRDQLFFRVRDN